MRFLLPLVLLGGCAAYDMGPPGPPPPWQQPPPWQPPPPTGGGPGNAAGLRFFVAQQVAAPGSTVSLVLDNRTGGQVGYNLCSSGLERLTPAGPQPVREDGVCTRELRLLRPGEAIRYERRLPPNLASGTYRFRTGVEAGQGVSGFQTIFSEPFGVR